jgi:hypothetical protein
MSPHPILMQLLYRDRGREIEALLFQRQHAEQGNKTSPSGRACWHRLSARILVPLVLPRDLAMSKATRSTTAVAQRGGAGKDRASLACRPG